MDKFFEIKCEKWSVKVLKRGWEVKTVGIGGIWRIEGSDGIKRQLVDSAVYAGGAMLALLLVFYKVFWACTASFSGDLK